MKDFNEAVEKGSQLINGHRDMKIDDMRILLNEVKRYGLDGAFSAITKAYNAGFAQGYELRTAEDKRLVKRLVKSAG